MMLETKLAACISEADTTTSTRREHPFFSGSLPSRFDGRLMRVRAAPPDNNISDPLTRRECDVLVMISQGLSNKRVARALEISPETVKSHLKHVFLKLDVGTRAQAVLRAAALELLQ
jgi:ATP/maltotriose-dependent transcriptional regulator MalT